MPFYASELPGTPNFPVKYNHFHEYDENNEELFEIREITPPLSASLPDFIPTNDRPMTRVAKIAKVFRNVSFKGKSNPKLKAKRPAEYGGSRHATFPRIAKEAREVTLTKLRREIIGDVTVCKFPILPDSPSQAKTVRFDKNSPHVKPVTKITQEDNGRQACRPPATYLDIQSLEENNPYWEQEFELPEPEISWPLAQSSVDGSNETYGYIPIGFSDMSETNCPPKEPRQNSASLQPFGERKEMVKNTKEEDNQPRIGKYAKLPCYCGDPLCNSAAVHILTYEGVKQELGVKVMETIACQLTLRLGPPPQLPPRDSDEQPTDILRIREQAVVYAYAVFAAMYTFQKLIVSVRRNLEKFQPLHTGIFIWEFQVVCMILNKSLTLFRTIPSFRTSTVRVGILSVDN